MKKLFTSLMLVLATSSVFAQTTEWTAGQDVTAELDWQNVKYTGDKSGWESKNAGIGWFYEEEKSTSGSIEMYNNSVGAETYQVFFLPAGYYKFNVQGFYRPGSAWAAGWDTNKDLNGIFFCSQVNVIDGEDGEGNVTTTYEDVKNSECSMFLRGITDGAYQGDEKILTDDMCGDWQRDNGFTLDGLQYWVPNSMWGAALYFEQDYYDNELMFINPTDGYVRIGIRKGPKSIADDWIIFNNFRCTYVSDAGEALQVQLAIKEMNNAKKEIEDLGEEISEFYVALSGLVTDAIMEVEGEVDETSVESCKAATEAYGNLVTEYTAYYENAKKLTKLISSCNSMLAANPNDTFSKAIDAAVVVEQNGNDGEPTIDDPKAYGQALQDLTDARAEFMKSAMGPEGYVDVSAFINYPWFCNNEYTPVYDEEKGYYVYSQEIEDTWVAGYGEKGVGDVLGEHSDWINIASDVKWTQDKEAVGEWIFNHAVTSGWMGGIGNVTMQHGYTAVGAWSGDPVGGYQEMRQVISGLPNGYYAMGAKYINAGNAPHEGQFVYINAGSQPDDDTMVKAQFTHTGTHWWAGTDNVPTWRTDDWEDLRTNMVYVDNGTVTIGSRSTWFYAVTGFRLYYFGETPDFAAILAPTMQEVSDDIATLAWPGDQKAAQEILDQIDVNSIADSDDYSFALLLIQDAKDYISEANATVANFNSDNGPLAKIDSKFMTGSGAVSDIASTAWANWFSYGEGDETYEDAQNAINDYKAYESYLNYYTMCETYAEKAANLKKVMDEQATELTAAYADAAKLAELQAALAKPYNEAYLAALGAADASASNPIDITSLLVNPGFETGNLNGWNGSATVAQIKQEAYQSSKYLTESWNTSSFDINQTVYSLPAGTYRVQVQAFYRDGGDAATAYNNWWYNAAADAELWETGNVKLYANDEEIPVTSLASEIFNEDTFTQYVSDWVVADEADENGNNVYVAKWTLQADAEEGKENAHPWDTKVEDMDEYYYYPNSTWGTMNCFENNPEAYINSIEVTVEKGGSITLGVRKEQGIGNDWMVMDNWKLYYLGGGDIPASEVTIGDITSLIDDYLNETGSVTIADITDMIDKYLAQ